MTSRPSISIYARLRRTIGLVFIIAIVLVILANVFSLVFAKLLVNRGFWLENKVWKELLLNTQTPAPELVLVGSSRVQNHFNTDYFNNRGRRTFNFGVPGIFPWDYPFMVQQAARVATKTVVISVPAEVLFYTAIGCPGQWTIPDLFFYAKEQPACLQKATLTQWLQPLPINALFSETSAEVHHFPCEDDAEDRLLNQVAAFHGSGLCDDPRKLMLLRYSRRWVAVFSNGDGLIVPDDYPPRQAQVLWQDKRGVPLDAKVVSFLRALADIVRDAGKTPIFVVDAAPVDHVIIDHVLEQQTGARTLYMNEISFSDDEIADHDHVGARGNSRLTSALFEQLFGVPDAQAAALESEARRL